MTNSAIWRSLIDWSSQTRTILSALISARDASVMDGCPPAAADVSGLSILMPTGIVTTTSPLDISFIRAIRADRSSALVSPGRPPAIIRPPPIPKAKFPVRPLAAPEPFWPACARAWPPVSLSVRAGRSNFKIVA